MATTAALAGAVALPQTALGKVLAEPLKPADIPTTLTQTIRHSSQKYREYRTLVAAPGEAPITRLDVLQKAANPDRTKNRRSLLYVGHLSDIHMIDAQSPARLDAMSGFSASLFAGVIHPQDTLTANVLASMTAAMAAAKFSPITGAPMAAALNTGDSADQHSGLELQWYIDMLDGGSVVPDSGKAGEYEGPQVWDVDYAWQPENANSAGNPFGEYGFPTLPGMLSAAVSQTVTSPGLPVPWYAVYGNHDTLINGFLQIDSGLSSLAIGSKKASTWETLGDTYLRGLALDPSPFTKLTNTIWTQLGMAKGMMDVTSDGARRLFDTLGFMQAHLDSPATPGPIGHGFTQNNVDTGQTFWMAELTPQFVLFGLDTCNQTSGPDGAVPQDQYDWLQEQLQVAQSKNQMAIVLSHHNSTTLENAAQSLTAPVQLVHAEEFIAMLQQFPNMVAWLNGHTHINTITAHPKSGGGGFWEVTTASCIDYPQQQQLVEFVDNRDGTMSIFTTTLDHASSPQWAPGDYSQEGLASLSRQLAGNDWIENPPMRVGSPLDRNCELMLPAPFDLSQITDTMLETNQASARAKILAYDTKAATQ